MVEMELIEHAKVAAADEAAATRANPARAANSRRIFANDAEVGAYAASTALDDTLEEEEREAEEELRERGDEGSARHGTIGVIIVHVTIS